MCQNSFLEMKFAKYLESQSVPEWRKAYIGYKGLKKKLKQVERVSGFTLISQMYRMLILHIVSQIQRKKSSYSTRQCISGIRR